MDMQTQPPYRYPGYRQIRALSSNQGNNALLSNLGFNSQGFTWNDLRVPVNALEGLGVSSPNYGFFQNDGGPAIGQSARFDSTSTGEIPYSAAIDLPTDFSISLWVRPDVNASGLSRYIMERAGHFEIESSNSQNFLRFVVDGAGPIQSADNVFTEGAWHHVVVVYSEPGNSELFAYVDGQLVASSGFGGTSSTSNNPIVVGDRSSGGREYDGLVDELAIYDRALTPAEVVALYNGGTGVVLEGDEPNLVAAYAFDGDATDKTVNDNTMTYVNPVYEPGVVGGSGSIGVRLPAFSGSTRQELFFALQLSHGVKIETNLQAHVHWSTTEEIPDGQFVRWGLEFTAAPVAGIWGTTTILVSDEIAAGSGLAYQHMITALGEAVVSPKNTTESMMLLGRVFRDGANDTFAGSAYLQEIDFHAQFVKLGSPEEFEDDSGV